MCGLSPQGVRLGFIELQAGGRAIPHRLVFATPPFAGVQRRLLELLRSRALLGICVDRITLGHGALTTRAWRRNLSVTFPLEQPQQPDDWVRLRTAAIAREAIDPTSPAKIMLINLRGGEIGGKIGGEIGGEIGREIGGFSFLHQNSTHLVEGDYLSVGVLVDGERALVDMYDAAVRRRNGKLCAVHIVESGELLLPRDPTDAASVASSPLPLLPSYDAHAERVVLPLNRPINALHTVNGSNPESQRESYHYQVLTEGLLRGQKLLVGALSHDNGQPGLLMSYSGAGGLFEEAHWALPVECGLDICSYQRLVIEGGLSSPLLLSLRDMGMMQQANRVRFTVHSQPLVVGRLKPGQGKRVSVPQRAEKREEGRDEGTADTAESLLPAMFFYSVRVPALHELLLHVECNQPVLLAASVDGLVALVSSSPRMLAEGFPGSPAELLLRSAEGEHTVHVGVTLLTPPDAFEIIATVEEAPLPPPQDATELAIELEAAGVLDGLSEPERASIIKQVQAEEAALGQMQLPAYLNALPSLRQRAASFDRDDVRASPAEIHSSPTL